MSGLKSGAYRVWCLGMAVHEASRMAASESQVGGRGTPESPPADTPQGLLPEGCWRATGDAFGDRAARPSVAADFEAARRT